MFHRRLPGAAPTRRPRRIRTALAGVLAVGALVLGAAPAAAVPAPPPNPSDGQLNDAEGQQHAAAAEVGRVQALVAAAEAELERVGVQAEAAGTAYLAAEEALTDAQARADATAAELAVAAEAVGRAQARLATFSRDTYMNGTSLATAAALLDSSGPGELVQRAALLEFVATNQVKVLDELEVARIAHANADSSARSARDEMAAAEAAAEATKVEADRQLGIQQGAYARAAAEKAAHEEQLQTAQIQLLQLQGARNAYQTWQQQKAAEEAAAAAEARRLAAEAAAAAEAARSRSRSGGGGGGGVSGGGSGAYVFPTSGRISSCFGYRWGALHGGVDIAAPIGTPIYAAHSGVVARTGFANGFGLAVYVRGDDGAVTVYGHVNREFVHPGERVVAGERIAEVGNRGESTGPHLHFEVHPGGALHAGHINPMPWLRARGVNVGGC